MFVPCMFVFKMGTDYRWSGGHAVNYFRTESVLLRTAAALVMGAWAPHECGPAEGYSQPGLSQGKRVSQSLAPSSLLGLLMGIIHHL